MAKRGRVGQQETLIQLVRVFCGRDANSVPLSVVLIGLSLWLFRHNIFAGVVDEDMLQPNLLSRAIVSPALA